MAHFLEQHKNTLGKYLEGMVLKAHEEEHTVCLPQIYSRVNHCTLTAKI